MKDKINDFSARIENIKETLKTEEATKTALIMPFFSILGYDIFNPNEFVPEFTCDVGIKKGEKVDYAIKINNKVEMLVEAKNIGYDLSKVDSQLTRYFNVSDANVALMTDGVKYKFYSDLEKKNIMDSIPFFEFDLSNISPQQISNIEKFQKSNYDSQSILSLAENLKKIISIQNRISNEFDNPSDDFVRVLISDVYSGHKTKQVLDDYKPAIKKAFTNYINDKVTSKLNNALTGIKDEDRVIEEEPVSKIVTTEDELLAFQIIKSILAEKVDINRIYYRDTQVYFNILLDDNARKWICRIDFLRNEINVYLNNNETVKIKTLNDLFNIKDILIECLDRVL